MGRKKERKDYGPYVEKTDDGRVVVTRRGYVAAIVVVALLVFGLGSKIVEVVRPAASQSVEETYRGLMESIRDDLGVPADSAAVPIASDTLRLVFGLEDDGTKDGLVPEKEVGDEKQ